MNGLVYFSFEDYGIDGRFSIVSIEIIHILSDLGCILLFDRVVVSVTHSPFPFSYILSGWPCVARIYQVLLDSQAISFGCCLVVVYPESLFIDICKLNQDALCSVSSNTDIEFTICHAIWALWSELPRSLTKTWSKLSVHLYLIDNAMNMGFKRVTL